MGKKPVYSVLDTPRVVVIRGENLNVPLEDFLSELKALSRVKVGVVRLVGDDDR